GSGPCRDVVPGEWSVQRAPRAAGDRDRARTGVPAARERPHGALSEGQRGEAASRRPAARGPPAGVWQGGSEGSFGRPGRASRRSWSVRGVSPGEAALRLSATDPRQCRSRVRSCGLPRSTVWATGSLTRMEPWYKVALPRSEVREGRSFNPNEFA